MKMSKDGAALGLGGWARNLLEAVRRRPEVSPEVLRSEIRIMHGHGPMGLLVNIVVATTLGLSFMAPGMGRAELLWILASIVLSGLRLADSLYRRNLTLDPRQLARARRHLRLGAALQGVLWGVAGTLLLPSTPIQQLFLIAVISGMTAGAVLVLSPIWSAYALYAVPAIIPLSIRLLGGALLTQRLTGGLGLVYGLTMLFIAARTSRWLEDSLVAAQENETLTRHLQSASEAMLQYHSHMEAAVVARTLELREANAQLQKEWDAKEAERVKTEERE